MNAGAGSVIEAERRDLAERVRAAFAAAGVDAEVHLCEGAQLAACARRVASEPGVDVVVAAGGAGTGNAVAAALVGGDVPLAVLPLGTLNHFARDLGMPADLDEAARAIAAGERARIDVGEVNGRVFVNNSSIGLYPEIVVSRDADRRVTGRGKWRAMAIAAWRVLRRFPLLAVRLVTRDRAVVAPTPFLFVGNNEYEINVLSLGQRARLDGGRLGLYMARCKSRLKMFSVIVRALLGRLDAAPELEAQAVTEARVDLRRRRVRVALDGEVTTMRPPLFYRIRAAALPVLRAAPAEAT